MVRSTSRPSAISFYGSLVGADAGARAVGPSDDDDVGGVGPSDDDDVGGAWSAAAAATYGAIEQRRPNSAAVPRYPFSLVSTRAREASGAMPADFSSTGASRLGGRW